MEWKCELFMERVKEYIKVFCMLGRHIWWFYGTVKKTFHLLNLFTEKGCMGREVKT
jgi:hypothetical protein